MNFDPSVNPSTQVDHITKETLDQHEANKRKAWDNFNVPRQTDLEAAQLMALQNAFDMASNVNKKGKWMEMPLDLQIKMMKPS